MSVLERDWWAGPHGEAFDRALNGLLDEDDAADVIALVQESFVPRANYRGAVDALQAIYDRHHMQGDGSAGAVSGDALRALGIDPDAAPASPSSRETDREES